MSSLDKQPAGLYIHIPFCLSRCGYCTFTSGVYTSGLADAYIAALKGEMRTRDYFSAQFLPETIFIGGGTPSCLHPRQLEQVLRILPQPIVGETTCECNPDSCTREKLLLLRDYGINRISFGVQTFDDEGLRLLQRRHDAKTARDAITLALELGFDAVSLDLINGWPGQTEISLRNDCEIAMSLGIQHISNYTLIVDPYASDYSIYREKLGGDEVDEERGRMYWDIIDELLEEKGFIHYETSNFCRPGMWCRHNVSTWKGGEYIGVGVGACSHISGERFGNIHSLEKYIQCSTIPGGVVEYRETLAGAEKARECAVFWLRLFDGIALEEFVQRTRYDFCSLYKDVLPSLMAEGVMEQAGGCIRVARRYQPVLDSVLEYFL